MSKHDIILHIVWNTKRKLPLISPDVEKWLRSYINRKCEEWMIDIYAMNMVPNHIHLLMQIKPTHVVAEIVKNLKGSTSYYIRNKMGVENFGWSPEYFVNSVSRKNLEIAINYVNSQKQKHHLS